MNQKMYFAYSSKLVDVQKLSDFSCENTEKGLKWTKKVENGWKKCFDQLLGARSTQKLVEVHNSPGTSGWEPLPDSNLQQISKLN